MTHLRRTVPPPLGISRPASEMTEDEAAWIREHAWTNPLRRQYEAHPSYTLRCACQGGPSQWCAAGRHDDCPPSDAQTWWETLICDRTGLSPVWLDEPYRNPTPGLTGAHCQRLAMVWLADRECRWACDCPCHRQDPPKPARTAPVPRPVYELVPLFDLGEVPV